MIKAEGHGQSECYECKKQGKYSLTWISFLYRIEKDNYEHLYCFEHAKKMEGFLVTPSERPEFRKIIYITKGITND